MRRIHGTMLAGALSLAFAACSSISANVSSVRDMEVKGTAFDRAMHGEYVKRAQIEADEGDYGNANHFLAKASDAAGGQLVLPEQSADWPVPAGAAGELDPARVRLLDVLDRNARTQYPELSARAQLLYDCWVEEWSENIQPDDIAACRIVFFNVLAELEEAMAPKPVAQPAPPPPPAPAPAPEPQPIERDVIERFVVYFDFDSSEITPKASSVIVAAAASVQGAKSYAMTVSGHTDRAGSNAYNARLAERRAEAVTLALIDAGIPAGAIKISHFGEEAPAFATADGVREGLNRRVEIVIDKTIMVTPAK